MCTEKNTNNPVNDTHLEPRCGKVEEDCAQDYNDIQETDDKLVGDDRELAEAQRSESIEGKDEQKAHIQDNNY